MTAGSKRLVVQLRPDTVERLTVRAAAQSVSINRLVAGIIEEHLEESSEAKTTLTALTAEKKLMSWVRAKAEEWKQTDCWDEHVTRNLFAAIEVEVPELYSAAAANGAGKRINIAIGSLLRKVLGAEPKSVDGRRLLGQPPRSQRALIQSYTRLFRPAATN